MSRINNHNHRIFDHRLIKQRTTPLVKRQHFDSCMAGMQTGVGPVEVTMNPVVCKCNWVFNECCYQRMPMTAIKLHPATLTPSPLHLCCNYSQRISLDVLRDQSILWLVMSTNCGYINDASYSQRCYRTLIGNHIQTSQWPSATPNPCFRLLTSNMPSAVVPRPVYGLYVTLNSVNQKQPNKSKQLKQQQLCFYFGLHFTDALFHSIQGQTSICRRNL